MINADGDKQALNLNLSNISIDEIADGNLLNKLGLSIVKFELPAIIGEIEKNSPAEASRLLKNYRIIAVNSKLINYLLFLPLRITQYIFPIDPSIPYQTPYLRPCTSRVKGVNY